MTVSDKHGMPGISAGPQATKWHKGCRYNLMKSLTLFTLKGKLKYIIYKMQCILNKYNNLNYLIPDTM